MDPILIMAALVLFMMMENHQIAIVTVLETLELEILSLGGNNAAYGMGLNANQRVTDANSFFRSKWTKDNLKV